MGIRQRTQTILKAEDGAAAILVAVMIVALLGVGALTVDAGALYAERRQMQTAADAAALAGVQALPDTAQAQSLAAQYAQANTHAAGAAQVQTSQHWSSSLGPDTIKVRLVDSDFDLFLARFLGQDSTSVGAEATARMGSPTTYGSGLMPFGIIANGTTQAPYGYSTGGVIPLVVDNGMQDQGNWHYVDLTPFTDGANNTKEVIRNGGTTDPVSIGDIIVTQTGAPNNPNFKEMSDYVERTCAPHALSALVYDSANGVYEPTHAADGSHCNRLITCPVITIVAGTDPYNWDAVTGSEDVRIEGFLNMFISNDPTAKDGTLLATFVQVVPANAFGPGGYVSYAGVIRWLEQ